MNWALYSIHWGGLFVFHFVYLEDILYFVYSSDTVSACFTEQVYMDFIAWFIDWTHDYLLNCIPTLIFSKLVRQSAGVSIET